MNGLPSFSEFFTALNGFAPLDWQTRLCERVLTDGWPSMIGVPTGLGKTACIDIAVYAIAVESALAPTDRRHPTRVWYVVNRRLLVDGGAERAEEIARRLAATRSATSNDEADALIAVADALRSRSHAQGVTGPLHASRLRGGYTGSELPLSTAQPAVLASTVPMYGSRLLFRGYGTSRYARPIEAALAGTDSLVLLDEAHLSRPLKVTTERLAECDASTRVVLPGTRSSPVIVQLTATGDDARDRFDLEPSDSEGDSVSARLVRQRIHAGKHVTAVSVPQRQLVRQITQCTLEQLQAHGQPIALAVFVNNPSLAVEVRGALESRLGTVAPGATIDVITGRMRPVDALAVRDRLLNGPTSVRAGRIRSDLNAHRIVIATQTLEVGADLDFDVLITQSAGRRAIVQRFGRLNRLGDMDDPATGIIVHASDVKSDPLYGTEPHEVYAAIESLGKADLSPARINEVIGDPRDLSTYVPELLSNHLDTYVKTSGFFEDVAPVDLFFDGFDLERSRARVQIAWRGHLPQSPQQTADGQRVDLVPPLHQGELVEVPLAEARELLRSPAMDTRRCWRVSDDRLSLETFDPAELRPGDQVVLPVTAGGYAADRGWDPRSTDPVTDLSPHGEDLVLVPEAVRTWLGPADEPVIEHAELVAALMTVPPRVAPKQVSRVLQEVIDEASVDDPVGHLTPVIDALDDAIEAQSEAGPLEGWIPSLELAQLFLNWLDGLGTGVSRLDTRGLVWSTTGAWIVRRVRDRDRVGWAELGDDAFDGLSNTGDPTELRLHMTRTGDRAERLASEIGLPPELCMAVRNAGRLHDLGKSDPRFQRWLGALDGEMRAKSGASSRDWRRDRVRAGWPSGGRHELLSVRFALELVRQPGFNRLLDPDPDLVLHLVASHHGRGRPGLIGVPDDSGGHFDLPISLLGVHDGDGEDRTVVVDGTLSSSDWDQPSRFASVNTRYGRRGVALLEAIVRQADWIESALGAGRNDEETDSRKGVRV